MQDDTLEKVADFIKNRKARYDLEILEELEAGIELFGHEVRALRTGMGSLQGAYVIVRGNEAFLVGMTIPPYQQANTPESYDPERARRLLLSKKELIKLGDVEKQQGLTIVPLSVYNKGRYLKVRLAIGRGKKTHDKRQSIKKRQAEKDIRRTLKNKR